MQYPGFVSGSYQSQAVNADSEATWNLYPEKMESQGSQRRLVLYPCPGFQMFGRAPEVGGRAMFSISENGRCFCVVGTAFREINADGTTTLWGAVASDSNKATLSYGGTASGQMLIVSGGNTYVFKLNTNVFSGPYLTGLSTMGAYSDGYGLVFNANTGKVMVSALNDFTTWDPLAFFQRSLRPDPWQAMVIGPDFKIWMIGTETSEIWGDVGAVPVPFQPLIGAVIPYGTFAPWSVIVVDDRISWISHTAAGQGIFVSAQGYYPNRISNHAVELALSNYARSYNVSNAEGLFYQDQGHTFTIWSFPSATATWVFDPLVNMWHQRGVWSTLTATFGLWAPRVHCHAFGRHLTMDSTTGIIASMDVTFGSEVDGSAIRRLRRAPGIVNEHHNMPYAQFELMIESGLGLQTGQGSVPKVMMRYSDDGGHTWSNERMADAGKAGQYRKRVQFKRCGCSRDRVFEVSMSDPIPWRLLDAWLNNTDDVAA